MHEDPQIAVLKSTALNGIAHANKEQVEGLPKHEDVEAQVEQHELVGKQAVNVTKEAHTEGRRRGGYVSDHAIAP
jgi:hypothetical protein